MEGCSSEQQGDECFHPRDGIWAKQPSIHLEGGTKTGLRAVEGESILGSLSGEEAHEQPLEDWEDWKEDHVTNNVGPGSVPA